jgi:hypothetical protein
MSNPSPKFYLFLKKILILILKFKRIQNRKLDILGFGGQFHFWVWF